MKTETLTTSGDFVAVTDHQDWMKLGRDAYQRLADEFGALAPEDWDRPTPCDGWSVRDLAGHVVGAMRSAARLREFASQLREISKHVKRTGENETEVMTAVQIARTSDLAIADIVAELNALVEPAMRGRSRLPRPVRRAVRFPVEIGSISERWDLDFLTGCILTRDAWLHRIDLVDALQAEATLDEHDRQIVGDVAVDWARRHGQAVRLVLSGPIGGSLIAGHDGPDITVDALDFCRILSGRADHPHPLMNQQVPF